MLQTSSSPRRANCTEGPSGSLAEIDRPRSRGHPENPPSRNLTPREQFQVQARHRPQQQRPQRNLYKNMTEVPHYFPEHSGPSFPGPVRFGGPRRPGPPPMEKESLDFPSLSMLNKSHKSVYDDLDGSPGSSAGTSSVSDEKFRIQMRNFPELPATAHERIREFGNEILACYSVQLCKFHNDSLIESTPNSFAVLTKKSRTGQRWLMVFKNERGRVNVAFNKLLTNQLLVRFLNPVSIEVEPARGLAPNVPQETCVFTFGCHTDANKFVRDIHESQKIAWNHREMFLEQTLREQYNNPYDYFMDDPEPHYGYYSPRPLSARTNSGYILPPDMVPPAALTPRVKVLPPVVPHGRPKRSPFTVSARTPRADLDENWRSDVLATPPPQGKDVVNSPPTPTSVTQSPIRKRSKGTSKDNYNNNNTSHSVTQSASNLGGGDGDFVYNSLTHAMALQQNMGTALKQASINSPENAVNSSEKEVSISRRFQTAEVLMSNKRDVGTGAPDEEFFSLGSGEIQVIDNGEEQFDEIKCYGSSGQLIFSQILFGWNKVRHAEGSQNPKLRWWIGAAVLGAGAPMKTGAEASRIREFKATFLDDESAAKFSELFHEGAIKGNNPEVRKKYLVQSLRI